MKNLKDEAIKWLGIAIRRHERHMAGEEPTTGKDGEISQRLMMEEMKYSMKLLNGADGPQIKWYQDNIDKFPDRKGKM